MGIPVRFSHDAHRCWKSENRGIYEDIVAHGIHHIFQYTFDEKTVESEEIEYSRLHSNCALFVVILVPHFKIDLYIYLEPINTNNKQ